MLKKDPSPSRSFSIPGKEISIGLLLSYRAHYDETPHTKSQQRETEPTYGKFSTSQSFHRHTPTNWSKKLP
jgi:hypothetical protein